MPLPETRERYQRSSTRLVAPRRTQRDGLRPSPAHDLDELAKAAQLGDRDAAERLMRQLDDRIRPLITHLVRTVSRGCLPEVTTEDIVQDVLLAVWRHDLERYDERHSAFMTFVSRRLRWHVIDALRAFTRGETDEITPEIAEIVPDDAHEQETLLGHHERERVYVVAIDTIAEDEAFKTDPSALLSMRRCDFEGATLHEVARELRMHASTVCRARQRAHCVMARRLEALGA